MGFIPIEPSEAYIRWFSLSKEIFYLEDVGDLENAHYVLLIGR